MYACISDWRKKNGFKLFSTQIYHDFCIDSGFAIMMDSLLNVKFV